MSLGSGKNGRRTSLQEKTGKDGRRTFRSLKQKDSFPRYRDESSECFSRGRKTGKFK